VLSSALIITETLQLLSLLRMEPRKERKLRKIKLSTLKPNPWRRFSTSLRSPIKLSWLLLATPSL
jgi:hypothetical protein